VLGGVGRWVGVRGGRKVGGWEGWRGVGSW